MPLPILTGVDAISPFIDRNYSANTFFAHSGTGLLKVVKSPTTGLWSQRQITLPPSATTTPATPINSYTTHIQVTDSNGQAAPNVSVALTATNVTSVYINHLYYLVGPSPIEVTTDQLGTVTIVETTSSLAGTRFGVSVAAAAPIEVNTMDTAWKRNAQYTTAASLQSAQIVNRDGTTRKFIPAGTSSDDLNGVALSNQNLAKAYTDLSSKPAPPPGEPRAAFALAPPRTAMVAAAAISSDDIWVDIGDLYSWLESGFEAVVEIFEDIANGVWHFICTIGGAVYRAIIDTVEAVVAAATWVYNAIKVAIEDVIKFLEFLFGWQDILTTHNVLKNLFLCLGQYAIDGIETTKTKMAGLFQQLQHEINGWANIPDFNQSASSTLASNPPASAQNSAPANLGIHHFQGSAASSSSAIGTAGPAEAILQDLVKLMEAEGETLSAAVDAINTQIIQPFSSLTVTEVIKRLLAIIADTLLQSAENVIVTLLDVLEQLVVGTIDLLTTSLDIPVLSWLYKEISGEDLSILDVICLIVAIPVTIIYKAAADKAPFPSGDPFTKTLLGATSFAQIQASFLVPAPAAAAAMAPPRGQMLMATASPPTASAEPAPVLDQDKLKTFGFVTGIVSLFGGIGLVVVTNLQRVLAEMASMAGSQEVPLAKTLATIAACANIAYVSPNLATLINARTDNWYSDLNNALTVTSIVKGFAGIPAAAYNNATANNVFAFVESFINVVWNVPVIANIVANQDAWNSTYKSLIPESIGNFAFNVGGILEFPIALAKAEAKLALIAVQAASMLVYGVMMVIAGSIYQFADNQQH